MSKHKKHGNRSNKGPLLVNQKIQAQIDQVRAALLSLDDEQLARAVGHLCPFTQDGERARMRMGYQVRSLTSDTLYSSEAEMFASEAQTPFTFVVPTAVALRARLARATSDQLLSTFKALSEHAHVTQKMHWHERLLAVLPDLASKPLPDEPPVVNPDLDTELLDAGLRQAAQAHKDAITQALIGQVVDLFTTRTRYEIDPDRPGTLIDTRMHFILEDYETIGDFLEEWDTQHGRLLQLNGAVYSKAVDMLIEALPQTLDWLRRENPTYYRDLLAYLTYYAPQDFNRNDDAQIAQAIFTADIIGDTFLELENAAYEEIADLSLDEILGGAELLVAQSRQKMMELPQLTELLRDLESYCYTTAIVTLTTEGDDEPLTMDLHREDGVVQYGYAPHHKDLLMARLINFGGLILRSFLEEKNPDTGFPIKELRGWSLVIEDGNLVVTRIPADDLYWACNTDSQTGARLPPEPDVKYC